MLTLHDKVIRNSETAYRNIEGEGLIMSPADSMLHSLNEVASAIWEFISEEHRVSDIIDMVLDEFDIDYKTAKKDVLALLKNFQQKGLIKITPKNHD